MEEELFRVKKEGGKREGPVKEERGETVAEMCFRILVDDVLHLFMVWNICLMMLRCVAFFMLHLFNSVNLCYFSCLKHLTGLMKS